MAPRGRAPQGEYSNKLATLSTRITEDLRRALETAKTESGRSLSQEIEARLRASFENERAISDAFGDRQTYAVMRIIGGVLDALRNPGEDRPDWLDDPYAHDAMVGAVLNVLEVFRPAAEREDGHVWGKVLAKGNAQFGVEEAAYRLPKAVKEMLDPGQRSRLEAYAANAKKRRDESQELFDKSMAKTRAQKTGGEGSTDG